MFRRFAQYYKPHMKLFLFDLFCAFLVALMNLFYPFITRNIINIYIPNKNMELVLIWLLVLLSIYVAKAFLNFIIQYWGHAVGVRIQYDMRTKMFKHLERLPFSFYDENKTGTVMSRIINDLMDISEFAHHAPEDIFISGITIIGAIIMIIFTVNPYLALIIGLVIPVIVFFAFKMRKTFRESFKQMRIKTAEINSRVESSISGIRVSRAYAAELYEIEKFGLSNDELTTTRMKNYKVLGIFNSGMTLLVDMLYVIALTSAALFFFNDLIDAGEFTSYLLYIGVLIAPIRTLTATFEQIQSGMSGYIRYEEILNEKVEEESPNAVQMENFDNSIKYSDVTFSYTHDEERLVLDHINMEIKKGETIALIGPTGGGKTTLCHLLPRFYELDGGSIKIDDTNIKDISRLSLRHLIGLVSQDVFLFAGTILENIKYGKLDASMDEVIEASKKAMIYDFIMNLPDGFDTYVGERGIKLSGGQKQRISIARAFLKNPPILILDEATSALDNATEVEIQKSLDELSVGRTTLVVAHRLSTVKNATKIYVITPDGIIESGSHDELMALNGVYKNLYTYQLR